MCKEKKNEVLAINLAKAETEDDVINILKAAGVWDNNSLWLPLGGNSNNYSIIGNQQSSPDSAFVEKIINSIDACLNKECLKRCINPMGPNAPQSMAAALKQFYGIPEGGLRNVESKRRSELAKNIIVAATGKNRGGEINLCIADRGEGQTPKHMPDTILSISKSNKLKIPFVQGKFNMGGTGVLPFCGEHRLELIISRRCPDIPNAEMDETYDQWSVTVVRREPAREGRKSSMYTYLTDAKGNMLTFEAKSLPIVPRDHVKGTEGYEYEAMEYGTFIKLYNYALSGYKTSIALDFHYRLSLLIPDLALPVRIRDCRDFNGHTNAANLSGLISRLYDNRKGVIEDSFPSSSTFVVDGQTVNCSVYLFKKGEEGNYRGKNAGVLFTVNGQTQGILKDSFFNGANLSYIKSSILVIADCTHIDIDHQEELFMTSRDRIRKSDFSAELKDRIEQELKEHPGLKQAANARRMEALKNKIADNKPLKDVLQNIMKKSSVLTRLFIQGQEISSPFSDNLVGIKDKYTGKKHPTFFALSGKLKDGQLSKVVPCNRAFRVQFSTDVENDYFYRPEESASLMLKMDGEPRKDLIKSLTLFNGVATLTVYLPEGAAPGDVHVFSTEIEDDYISQTFENTFTVTVAEAADPTKGGSGEPHKPADPKKKGGDGKTPGSFAMPEIIRVRKDEWPAYDMSRFSALVYRQTDNGGDYYLNMDNDYLLTELKGMKDKGHVELTEARYTYSMALIGMSVVSYYKNHQNPEEPVNVEAMVGSISSMIAPVLIPMLEAMANLDVDSLNQVA